MVGLLIALLLIFASGAAYLRAGKRNDAGMTPDAIWWGAVSMFFLLLTAIYLLGYGVAKWGF
jgi:hypothetical protein